MKIDISYLIFIPLGDPGAKQCVVGDHHIKTG